MNDIKLLRTLVFILILVNLGFISVFTYLHFAKPKHSRKNAGPRDYIISKLNFDKAQISEYDKLIDWHRSEIRKYETEMLGIKKELYSSISNAEYNVSQQDSLIAAINQIQNKIEHTHYKHFKEVKSICKPQQYDAFLQLSNELSELFNPHSPKPPHK